MFFGSYSGRDGWELPLARRQMGILLGVTAAALLLCGILSIGRVARQAEAVCGDTLRLHIRADSNSVAAQRQKLLVRDAILGEMQAVGAGAGSVQQAGTLLLDDLPRLVQAASAALHRAGNYRDAVTLGLVREYFSPTRYQSFTTPPGDYLALRVDIGSHQGQNWWCVLYPTLCMSACSPGYSTPEENALVLGNYEIRFALLDGWHRLCAGWRSLLGRLKKGYGKTGDESSPRRILWGGGDNNGST